MRGCGRGGVPGLAASGGGGDGSLEPSSGPSKLTGTTSAACDAGPHSSIVAATESASSDLFICPGPPCSRVAERYRPRIRPGEVRPVHPCLPTGCSTVRSAPASTPRPPGGEPRSEEHTSELQSLM